MSYGALLAELQKRREAASPPPWHTSGYDAGPVFGTSLVIQDKDAEIAWFDEDAELPGTDEVYPVPHAANAALAAPAHEMAACVEALVEVLDGEDTECRLDHHGRCQAHRMEKDCSVLIARTRLTALAAAMGVEAP